MDPVTAIGAAASIVQLADLCVKSANAARDLWQSYVDAPAELRQLAERIETLRFQIEQIRALGDDVSANNIDDILPLQHRSFILVTLQDRTAELESLRSLRKDRNAIRTKARWAALERSKASRLLARIRDADESFNMCLVIATMRLQALNQTPLRQLVAAQQATLPALEAASLNMQTRVQEVYERHEVMLEKVDEVAQTSALVQRSVQSLEGNILQAFQQSNSILMESMAQRVLSEVTATIRCSQPKQQRARKPAENAARRKPVPATQSADATGGLNFDLVRIKEARSIHRTVEKFALSYGHNVDDTFSLSEFQSHGQSTTGARPYGTKISLQSKRYEKKLRVKARAWLNLFGPRVVEFEFAIRLRTAAWMSPSVQGGVRIVNIRPSRAPIFKACCYGHLEEVKMLLESGEAGINDQDEFGLSLLCSAIRFGYRSTDIQMVRYLLDRGCDPNMGSILPLHLALALDRLDSARLLLKRGADMYAGQPLDAALPFYNPDRLRASVEFLITEDYWGWQTADTYYEGANLLTAARSTGSLDLIMKAVDDFCLPVSLSQKNLPLGCAISGDHIEATAVLLQLGAQNNGSDWGGDNTTPIAQAAYSQQTALTHYLLFRGASSQDPRLWATIWDGILKFTDKWRFQELEGRLLHLLLHDGCQLDDSSTLYYNHKTNSLRPYPAESLHLNIFGPARLWSFDGGYWWMGGLAAAEAKASDFRSGTTQLPVRINWSPHGLVKKGAVYTLHVDSGGTDNSLAIEDSDGEGTDEESTDEQENDEETAEEQTSEQEADEGETDEEETGEQEVDEQVSSLEGSGIEASCRKNAGNSGQAGPSWDIHSSLAASRDGRDDPTYHHDFFHEDDGRDGIPFDETTLFYENISTESGRRQMSTFPMLRALCNALQLAGYRLEMDDDGDVWFDDDDGDCYFDAREHQPGPGEDDGLIANCPICRNPEKYGLGYILRREEAGLSFLREYRERNKGKKKGKPSGRW